MKFRQTTKRTAILHRRKKDVQEGLLVMTYRWEWNKDRWLWTDHSPNHRFL